MTVYRSDMFDPPMTKRCDYCHEIMDEWINVIPGGNFYSDCAQMTMRHLLEDLIEIHNPDKQHVSLLDIMYHGNRRKERSGFRGRHNW